MAVDMSQKGRGGHACIEDEAQRPGDDQEAQQCVAQRARFLQVVARLLAACGVP